MIIVIDKSCKSHPSWSSLIEERRVGSSLGRKGRHHRVKSRGLDNSSASAASHESERGHYDNQFEWGKVGSKSEMSEHFLMLSPSFIQFGRANLRN
jgi:hypothetical protein